MTASGAGGGDVHGELAAERRQRRLVALALERHQHADLAEAVGGLVVHVVGDHAVRRPDSAAVRRTLMFSPMVATISLTWSSTVIDLPG